MSDTILPRRKRLLIWAAVAAGVTLFVGANVHLLYVAMTSQPECVAHAKEAAGSGGYAAAKPSC